jgi:2-(1,2-epoxy-1,2-dihydrophenyl)acetyl-CoA isomerase
MSFDDNPRTPIWREAIVTDNGSVVFERNGPVARITLNRPEKLNAIKWRMIEEIIDFAEDVGRDDEVRVLVITGAGRAFSAGDDIGEGMGERRRGGSPGGINADLGLHHQMTKTLMTMPKPVVAAINGRCHGAGWVIALSCDFRVAADDILIGDIRSNRAIFAGQAVPLLLPRLIGQSRAMDLLVTGRVIDAAEAERIGILHRVWPRATYEQQLEAFVHELAEGPTRTYAAWKLTVNRAVLLELDGYTHYERRMAELVRQTEDAKEGGASFREKRQPLYTGR